jgi:hypothetical protein
MTLDEDESDLVRTRDSVTTMGEHLILVKPWQQKVKSKVSQLEQMDDSDDSVDQRADARDADGTVEHACRLEDLARSRFKTPTYVGATSLSSKLSKTVLLRLFLGEDDGDKGLSVPDYRSFKGGKKRTNSLFPVVTSEKNERKFFVLVILFFANAACIISHFLSCSAI